jgi:hypothetical protein
LIAALADLIDAAGEVEYLDRQIIVPSFEDVATGAERLFGPDI